MTALTDCSEEEKKFLITLFEQTVEKSASQASMYDIGAMLEMSRNDSLKTAESLMSVNLVEVKTLSGGIGLTDGGIKTVKKLGVSSGAGGIVLGDAPVMDKEQCDAVDTVCAELKVKLGKMGLEYDRLEEVVADVKTMAMQLISPKPKTAVFKTCLASVKKAVKTVSAGNDISGQIAQLLGE